MVINLFYVVNNFHEAVVDFLPVRKELCKRLYLCAQHILEWGGADCSNKTH